MTARKAVKTVYPPGQHPGGRPPYKPDAQTAQKVKLLAGLGVNTTDIGKVVDISAPTVRKYYMREVETGGIEAAATVAQSLFRAATQGPKPSVIAMIFFLKCRAGWREDGGEPQGKKEAAELWAKVADKDTKWDGLLAEHRPRSEDPPPDE